MTRNKKGQFNSEGSLDQYKELHDNYSGWLSINTDKQNTIDRRKKGTWKWFEWCEETSVDPLSAKPRDVRSYITDMQAEGLAGTTIASRFASVSKFYFDAVRNTKEIEENPAGPVILRREFDIKNNAEFTKILNREGREDIIAPAFEKFKSIFDNPTGSTRFSQIRNELICRLAWQTAARSDELSRMRLDNLNRDAREIKIRSSKLNQDDHEDLYHRYVFYEKSMDLSLAEYLQERSQKDPEQECPYLLMGSKGEQLDPAYISRIIKKSAHEANIQEPLVRDNDGGVKQWLYTAHRMRHARITHLANKTDMDLNVVRMIAGHASMDTTLSYIQPDWDEARAEFRDAV